VRLAGPVAGPLLFAGALGGLGAASAQAAPAGCQNWTGARPPGPAQSPTGVRAVGEYDSGTGALRSGPGPLRGHPVGAAEHARPGSDFSILAGVRPVSDNEAWAVGDSSSGSTLKSLVLRFTALSAVAIGTAIRGAGRGSPWGGSRAWPGPGAAAARGRQ
jgi:hypothetical protein